MKIIPDHIRYSPTPVICRWLQTWIDRNDELLEFLPNPFDVSVFGLIPVELLETLLNEAHKKHMAKLIRNVRIEYKLHYELTLTVPDTLTEPFKFLLASVGKIINSKMFSIAESYFTFEKTENGVPHVHMLLRPKDGCTVQSSKIKKIYPYRFSFAKVRDLHSFCEYLIKDLNVPQHIEFNDYQNPPPSDYANQNRC